ncbi:phage integrase SAM-like domain-containing protein [Kaistella polysaccharea]|uniref:phage integrase SAM-like domain-containing protein n=1 Tax=Kaistella polysaccharea TaxID=2878534 RepID=UPI001CF1CB16|nr:phage integrase SAM-like domain-containing protein [Kaistella polysaccharea]
MSLTYRIRNKSGTVKIYLRYRPNAKTDIWIVTPFSVLAEHWDQENQCYSRNKLVKMPRNDVDKNRNEKIKTLNRELEKFADEVDTFVCNNGYEIDSQKLKSLIDEKFGKKKPKNVKEVTISNLMTNLIDRYIEQKSETILGVQQELSSSTIRTYNTLKNRIQKFDKNLKVEDVDDDFRIAYIKWATKLYTETTIHNNLKKIKTFIKYAEGKNMNINKSVLNWRFMEPERKYPEPVISFEEQHRIKNLTLHGTLDNSRDWILIACQLSLRISDLLPLKKEMIVDGWFVPLTQKKVKKQVLIPLPENVIEILNKRNGEFPPRVSDQKYNQHIKKICRLAKMNERIMGGKRSSQSKKVDGIYEKWELITSHSCRRTFVTLFRKEFKDDVLISNNTGHASTKTMDGYDFSPPSLKTPATLKKKIDELYISQQKERMTN